MAVPVYAHAYLALLPVFVFGGQMASAIAGDRCSTIGDPHTVREPPRLPKPPSRIWENIKNTIAVLVLIAVIIGCLIWIVKSLFEL